MADNNAEAILNQVNTFIAKQKSSGSTEDTCLPFETVDTFSTDPISFEDATAVMLERAEELFAMSRQYNRQSKEYLKTCEALEKAIGYLGSACITRDIMVRRNHDLPKLEQLSTVRLYKMVSLNFCKLDTASVEFMREKQQFPFELFNMQSRYYRLIGRLQATESKIYDLFCHPRKAYIYVERALSFTPKTCHQERVRLITAPSVFRAAPSFAPIKEVLQTECQHEEEKQAENRQDTMTSVKEYPEVTAESSLENTYLNQASLPEPSADIPTDIAGSNPINFDDEMWDEFDPEDKEKLFEVLTHLREYDIRSMIPLINDPEFCLKYPLTAAAIRLMIDDFRPPDDSP